MKIKNLLFILFFTIAGISVSAQSKNILGGNIYYYEQSDGNNYNINNAINFGIYVDYFHKVHNNIYIGATIGADFYYVKSRDYRQPTFYIKPTFMYCKNITERLRYTPQIYFAIGAGRALSNDAFYNLNDSFVEYGFGIKPFVFDYKISDNIAISFAFGGYEFSFVDYNESTKHLKLIEGGLNGNITGGFRFIF